MLSSKLLHSSNTGARIVNGKTLPVRWTSLDPSLGKSGFLWSWIEDDFDEESKAARRINWRAFGGMAIAFAISVGFWAGVGVALSRLL